jgi:hypothetical protein
MKNLLSLLALAVLLAVTGLAEKIDLGSGKTLHLTLPATWSTAGLPARSPGAPEVGQNARYVTRSGSNDALLITVLPVADDRFSDPENLKSVVEMATQQFVPGSVEGQASLKEFKFAGASGFSATFTDASLVGKPTVKDDYKAMTSCFAYLGEHVLVTATVFTDDLNGKAYAEALRILKSISLSLPKDTI